MTRPEISVVMPVHQDTEFLDGAVSSILGQSFSDLELIVVIESGDDVVGSRSLRDHNDDRLNIIENNGPAGLIGSLNTGVTNSKGRYIARMDSDDISLPTRFERQVEQLDRSRPIGMLGTQISYVDGEGRKVRDPKYFTNPDQLLWDMFFNSPIPHPSAMIRREVDLGARRISHRCLPGGGLRSMDKG